MSAGARPQWSLPDDPVVGTVLVRIGEQDPALADAVGGVTGRGFLPGQSGNPNGRPPTRGLFQSAERKKKQRLDALEGRYRWNPQTQLYHDTQSTRTLTPVEWDQEKQENQDSYEQEVGTLGGEPDHFSYGGGSPRSAENPAGPTSAKIATKAQVTENARRKGIPYAQAEQGFKSQGYVVQ